MVKKIEKQREMSNDSFYENLMNYYIHQNGLMWSRLQTILAFQGAFLIVIMNTKGIVGSLLSLIAALMTVILYIFMMRDRKIRDEIEKKFKEIPDFVMNTTYLPFAKSKYLAFIIFSIFMCINLFAFFFFLFNKESLFLK